MRPENRCSKIRQLPDREFLRWGVARLNLAEALDGALKSANNFQTESFPAARRGPKAHRIAKFGLRNGKNSEKGQKRSKKIKKDTIW